MERANFKKKINHLIVVISAQFYLWLFFNIYDRVKCFSNFLFLCVQWWWVLCWLLLVKLLVNISSLMASGWRNTVAWAPWTPWTKTWAPRPDTSGISNTTRGCPPYTASLPVTLLGLSLPVFPSRQHFLISFSVVCRTQLLYCYVVVKNDEPARKVWRWHFTLKKKTKKPSSNRQPLTSLQRCSLNKLV